MPIRVTHWLHSESPTESGLRELFRRENLTPYEWWNAPGDTYAAHSHSYDKVIYVVHGSITWVLSEANQEIVTRAGDRIDLPRGTVHAAHVGPEGVMCLEAHRD